MSGKSGERVLPVTTRAVMWPLCSCGTMLERARMATGVDPDSTAFTTSLPLLKGIRTISAPVSCLSFSMKCASGNENVPRSEEHTSELQSRSDLVCRLLLEKKKKKNKPLKLEKRQHKADKITR